MEDTELLREFIIEQVNAGFESPDNIYEYALDFADTEIDAELQRFVRRTLNEALAQHYAQQLTWLTPTDCDKLDAAFDNLNRQGILARHDFACCQSCGRAEIWDEIQQAVSMGQDVIGFTFYHQQDTEHALEGLGVTLYYDTINKEYSAFKIGNCIVAALESAGLCVEWIGSSNERIIIKPFDWKRRRTPPLN
jgi:hypothetical protein